MKNAVPKLYMAIVLVGAFLVAWSLFYNSYTSKKSASNGTSRVQSRKPAASNPSKITSGSTPHINEKTKRLREIVTTHDCYGNESCNFSNTDPRSYEIELGHKLASQIRDFHKSYLHDPDVQNDLLGLAKEHFKNENGFVQEAAFDILKDLPQSEASLDIIHEGIKDGYNPSITEMVIPELKKYLGTSLEDKVHEIMDEMAKGAHFVSQTATENILDFINPQSYDRYLKLLSQLHPRSKAYKNLNSALREYESRQTGG